MNLYTSILWIWVYINTHTWIWTSISLWYCITWNSFRWNCLIKIIVYQIISDYIITTLYYTYSHCFIRCHISCFSAFGLSCLSLKSNCIWSNCLILMSKNHVANLEIFCKPETKWLGCWQQEGKVLLCGQGTNSRDLAALKWTNAKGQLTRISRTLHNTRLISMELQRSCFWIWQMLQRVLDVGTAKGLQLSW